ncbi:glutathione S-transferase family protein [Candidatus Phycosocius spiralis]|uniref:Thiol:disulfide oxidoreductase n=1 Tax=Candidatus Phycosocius spiralis TaxID=2815099 RepID=A0ABQ4PX79_9PROT|nr:glutathione S-transferase N-terminal domain-containing protein [Candidatus Phycosocius spiralis]GIU67278.1 thiol:disulfide oxidoreductase [Candidatus Phycosocius spiralis]
MTTPNPRPIELYYWPTPNGWKISIALEEMGLPYEMKPVNIGKGEQFEPGFLAISPNNRMPAIIDPEGPDGKPISVFESGAILMYLGRKTGQYYPQDERARVKIDEWLMWQMAGLGPMSGQASHFRLYAPNLVDDPKLIEYGQTRYTNEVNRLYGVMERQLQHNDYLAGDYSIADMACYPWIRGAKLFGQDLSEFPNLLVWFDRIDARPCVKAGLGVGEMLRKPAQQQSQADIKEAAKALFGQTAAVTKT